jgi:Ca2+-binding RTX toxin-like protein
MTTIRLSAGATEADIIRALASMTAGGTLVLQANETISIRTGLAIDVRARDIHLDLNGSTLKQDANVAVVRATGHNHGGDTIALSKNAGGNPVVTYSHVPTDLTVGSWVKVISDDVLPGDFLDNGVDPTRLGQALEVESISGNTVTFKGSLMYQDLYTTNVRAATIHSGTIEISNGTIIGTQGAGFDQPLVQVRSTVGADIHDLNIRDGASRGISVVNSVNANVSDVVVKNLDNAGFMTSVAVHSSSSLNTTVTNLFAEDVKHATDNNTIGIRANSAFIEPYGADIGFTVKDTVAYGTFGGAYSWHAEGINGVYDNVMAFNSHSFFTARGVGGTMTNSGGANNERGIVLYQYGNGDGRNITIDSVHLRECLIYGMVAVNNPVNNIVRNSIFEQNWFNPTIDASAATLINTFFTRILDFSHIDVMVGSNSVDRLLGGKGSDSLFAHGGNDYLWGGANVDLMAGGAGRDRFAYHDLEEGGDLIADFTTEDVIDVGVLGARLNWSRSGESLLANGFLHFRQDGLDTVVEADADGGGNTYVVLATLTGVVAATLGANNIYTKLSAIADTVSPGVDTGEIFGTEANDVLVGTRDADTLLGLAGDDRLEGFGGNDKIEGGAGQDLLQGGAGSDTLNGGNGDDTLDGGDGIDAMAGGSGDDVYIVQSVGDTVTEGFNAGIDRVETSVTLDGALFANVENLTLIGGLAIDGLGNDLNNVLMGNIGRNILDGGLGNDTIMGGDENDLSYGREGDDLLIDGTGRDTVYGGSGNDTIDGGDGVDHLYGEGGNDSIIGATGNDLMDGGSDNDTLMGSGGADMLAGGTGDDHLSGGSEADRLEGGDGADTLLGGTENDDLMGGNGMDLLRGGEGSDRLFGGADNDILRSDGGDDQLRGDDGDDLLIGGQGADSYVGGAGNDTVSYTEAEYALTISMVNATLSSGEAFGDIFGGIERLVGTRFGDTIVGNHLSNILDGDLGDDAISGGGGADQLFGGEGNDVLRGDDGSDNLFGGNGNDVLMGGTGFDNLTGGTGADVFAFQGRDTWNDRVTDFVHGEDRVQIQRDSLGSSPDLDFRFIQGSLMATPNAGTAAFLYNQATGQLFWDGDGRGGANALAIITVTPHTTFTLSDLLFV